MPSNRAHTNLATEATTGYVTLVQLIHGTTLFFNSSYVYL